MRIERYGKQWDISSDPALGQEGLIDENHYRKLFSEPYIRTSLTKQDIWLDIGANIGAFTVRASEYVLAVIAVEPEPDCFQQLENNVRLNNCNNVVLLEAAVVGDDRPSVELALSNSYSSTHRVGTIRGRESIEVAAIDIETLIHQHEVNKIKMDCEGSELEILEAMTQGLYQIEEIVFEYHFSFLRDQQPWDRYFKILQRLEENDMTILRGARQESGTWHTIVWAKRI